MNLTKNLIAEVLKNPSVVSSYSLKDWDLLIRQGRQTLLLARIYQLFHDKGLFDGLPGKVKDHLISANAYSEKLNNSLNWEFRCIEKALSELSIPVIFLKGASYFLAANQAAKGRLFSDIDLLVEKKYLPSVEDALKKHGWVGTHQNEYDQRYYRQWMHEIPPMIHLKRHTTLDVHHNILPATCNTCPDSEMLFSNIIKVTNTPFWVFAPEDRVLHSAAHLFHEGEFKHGLRDISDIDLLLREFSAVETFWNQLLRRSTELNQHLPLFYALRYASKILATPIPEPVARRVKKNAPNILRVGLMDFLFFRALAPEHSSCNDAWTGLARWLLFIRSHWLRMPIKLLIPHLFRKFIKELKGEATV